MTMAIQFYMASGIAKLEIDIHYMVLVSFSHILFLHSYNDALN